MYLVFDTETTGLPKNYNAPVSWLSNWPRIVQIAWKRFDKSGNELESKNYIIKPDGFPIPYKATRIHGISTEFAIQNGVDIKIALDNLSNSITLSKLLVAHNINFDEKIVGAEFLRLGLENPLNNIKKICLMKSSTEYCKIHGQYGYKWPSLTELHYKIFRTNFKEAHNAEIDVEACANCFFKLIELGVLKSI